MIRRAKDLATLNGNMERRGRDGETKPTTLATRNTDYLLGWLFNNSNKIGALRYHPIRV
jgi:hypothetical protein